MRIATIGFTTLVGVALGCASACGGSTDSDTSSTGGSGAVAGTGGGSGSGGSPSGGSGGIDCSNVGCGAPPMCDVGCTAACGCCNCGEGEQLPADGGTLVCTGGCYTLVTGKTCGGIAGVSCASDEFCDFPSTSACGGDDSQGVCVKKPQACDADCPGVCGCDGKFYCNACNANAMGVDASLDPSCFGDAGAGAACASDSECNQGLKCCYPCGIPGCSNQCMAPMPNGQCPMFP
ncbi:MAG: hypothetical protein IPI67_22035 [Myxococcales bacterium]|nr:hypothetical protein [Myxococcales bacterium]